MLAAINAQETMQLPPHPAIGAVAFNLFLAAVLLFAVFSLGFIIYTAAGVMLGGAFHTGQFVYDKYERAVYVVTGLTGDGLLELTHLDSRSRKTTIPLRVEKLPGIGDPVYKDGVMYVIVAQNQEITSMANSDGIHELVPTSDIAPSMQHSAVHEPCDLSSSDSSSDSDDGQYGHATASEGESSSESASDSAIDDQYLISVL